MELSLSFSPCLNVQALVLALQLVAAKALLIESYTQTLLADIQLIIIIEIYFVPVNAHDQLSAPEFYNFIPVSRSHADKSKLPYNEAVRTVDLMQVWGCYYLQKLYPRSAIIRGRRDRSLVAVAWQL